jgi:hypothetical protein
MGTPPFEVEFLGWRTHGLVVDLVCPSTSRLKLCRYLSTRLETAPPKLEVSFSVTEVLWSESDAKETTPAAK